MDSFKSFEQKAWQTAADGYGKGFVSLTSQVIPRMLDVTAVKAGDRLLDVATGPGIFANEAVKRGAKVIGVDFSPEMLVIARKRFPDIQFEHGDAEALSFADATFDTVVMNFGLLHLADPSRAVREAFRVLKSCGRFAFTVWAPPAEGSGFHVILDVVHKYGSKEIVIPEGPPFFQFSEPSNGQNILRDAGFKEISSERLELVWELESASAFFDAIYTGAARMGALLRLQPEEILLKIQSTIVAEADARFALSSKSSGASTVRIPMPCILYAGAK